MPNPLPQELVAETSAELGSTAGTRLAQPTDRGDLPPLLLDSMLTRPREAHPDPIAASTSKRGGRIQPHLATTASHEMTRGTSRTRLCHGHTRLAYSGHYRASAHLERTRSIRRRTHSPATTGRASPGAVPHPPTTRPTRRPEGRQRMNAASREKAIAQESAELANGIGPSADLAVNDRVCTSWRWCWYRRRAPMRQRT